MDKIIFHVDVNSAFLSWEAVDRIREQGQTEDIRNIPSAVCGDIHKRRGVILAKSIPAKQYGIQTGEPVVDALKKCPTLFMVPPRHELYARESKKFINILREYTPDVEKYSIDECYMDMTGTELLFGTPIEAAHRIKDRIYQELGFTVNIGISTNKLLAKMAGDFKKPNLVHTLFPDEIQKKLWLLPVSELFFVGSATTKKLNSLGIRTIGDLANANVDMLRAHLKKHGEIIWNFANGIDISAVEQEVPVRKGYGNSTTIAFDVTNESSAKIILLNLAESVCTRLRADNAKAGVVAISIKDCEFNTISHQTVLHTHTNITNEVHATACKLFDEVWNGMPIRLLGIQTNHIIYGQIERQISLFDIDNSRPEKLEKMDEAIDKIRARYGKDAIRRATFLENKKGHT